MYSSALDFWYKKGKDLITKFTNSDPEPEIYTEELIDYIATKTQLSKGIILSVLLAEEDFLKEKGIMY